MLNNRWNQRVLGYDRGRQSALFGRFGLDLHNWRDLLAVLGDSAVTALGLLLAGLLIVSQ